MKIVRNLTCTIIAMALPFLLAQNAFAGDPAKGKSIYDSKGVCSTCHGPTGKGDGAAAAAMNPKPRSFTDGVFKYDTDGDGQTGTDTDLFTILKEGTAKYGGAPTMAGRSDLTDAELLDIVAYIRTMKN